MNLRMLSRRGFLRLTLYGSPAAVAAQSLCIEPEWLRIRRLKLSRTPTHRVVHFTDLHHKGDRAYLESVVEKINRLTPDLVCFTGDIVEDAEFLPEALELLKRVKAPMFGVPGNHDYWADVDFDSVAECFAASGGKWLMDGEAITRDGRVQVLGATCSQPGSFTPRPEVKQILLFHYPSWVEKVASQRFTLMLAGHSHGGQVRLPFLGPLLVPFGVGEFDLGLYQTISGPLYVNPGIGYFYLSIRFLCRPELTVIEI